MLNGKHVKKSSWMLNSKIKNKLELSKAKFKYVINELLKFGASWTN